MSAQRITFVRHGETTGQSSIRYYGATDIPLSAEGERQMLAVGAALRSQPFDLVFSSTLARSKRGAHLVCPSGPPPIAVAAFDEVSFGRWEGWTKREIEMRDGDAYREWQIDPESFTYPQGESRIAFRARVTAGLRSVMDRHPQAEWLMVLHRGVIAAALLHLLGDRQLVASLRIDLGSIHTIVRDQGGWRAQQLDGGAPLR